MPDSTEVGEYIIERKKHSNFWGIKYDIYLDDQHLGSLGNGESYKGKSEYGQHNLKIYDMKNHPEKADYDGDFILSEDGVYLSFVAANRIKMKEEKYPSNIDERNLKFIDILAVTDHIVHKEENIKIVHKEENIKAGKNICPRCGQPMAVQVVTEQKKAGCGTILWYFFLAITIFGILIIILLLLRNNSKNSTFYVCQNCGYKKKIK